MVLIKKYYKTFTTSMKKIGVGDETVNKKSS